MGVLSKKGFGIISSTIFQIAAIYSLIIFILFYALVTQEDEVYKFPISIWRRLQGLKDISTSDFSTPSFNPGPFNPRLFNHELFNPGLFNHEFLNYGVEISSI